MRFSIAKHHPCVILLMEVNALLPCLCHTDIAQEAVVVSVPSPQCYNAVMEVTDSDHKPVYAQLDVTVPSYTQVCVGPI